LPSPVLRSCRCCSASASAETSSPEARDLAGAFNNARYFHTQFFQDRRSAERALLAGDVTGLVIVAGDFARPVWSEDSAPVQLVVDGVDGRTARTISLYVSGAVSNWLGQRVLNRQSAALPMVQIEPRFQFNPNLVSRYFTAPGVIALIMTLSGALLAALLVAREWERGTMEALLATPAHAAELLIARIVTYLGLGVAAMSLTLVITVSVFEVPFRGSWAVLAVASALFMLTVLSLGFVLSGLARRQVVAGSMVLTVGFLPTVMLSGFLFDLRNAPEPIQWLSHLVSARYFVSILHTLFLAGDVWPVILPNLAGLAAIAVVLLAAVVRLNRKRLG
jgi:ABC-2 type transport system permease protein